jgi:hypothetical protein
MVQDIPAATLPPQVFVSENWVGFVPVIVMPVMPSVVVPVLVSVTVWGELPSPSVSVPKSRLSGTSFTVPTVSVMAAFAVLVVSVTEVAASVAVELAGTSEGAV